MKKIGRRKVHPPLIPIARSVRRLHRRSCDHCQPSFRDGSDCGGYRHIRSRDGHCLDSWCRPWEEEVITTTPLSSRSGNHRSS